ncbi:MAG TPA: hypothetical protein V6C69_08115, partial [Trichormus sp.]
MAAMVPGTSRGAQRQLLRERTESEGRIEKNLSRASAGLLGQGAWRGGDLRFFFRTQHQGAVS